MIFHNRKIHNKLEFFLLSDAMCEVDGTKYLTVRGTVTPTIHNVPALVNVTSEDLLDVENAKMMFYFYTQYWFMFISDKEQTYANACRLWYGGANAVNDPDTLPYWKKVSPIFDRLLGEKNLKEFEYSI